MIFLFQAIGRIVAEVEVELFQYVNLSFFVGAKTGKRCSNIYFRSYFPSDLKQKCIGLWGFLLHLCHPCLL